MDRKTVKLTRKASRKFVLSRMVAAGDKMRRQVSTVAFAYFANEGAPAAADLVGLLRPGAKLTLADASGAEITITRSV